jgi:hypothetical protein
MVILLKILLGLFTILDGFIIKYVYDDFKGVKDNESYTNSSLWQRIVLNSILAFSIIALSFLATFLVYVICVPMKIG